MPTEILPVFQGTIAAGGEGTSEVFNRASFLYLNVGNLQPDEFIELDFALLITLPEGVRVVPIEALKDTSFIDSFTEQPQLTTRNIIRIPFEYANNDLSMQLSIASSVSITVDVYAVGDALSVEDQFENLLEALRQLLNLADTVLDIVALLNGNPLPLLIGNNDDPLLISPGP